MYFIIKWRLTGEKIVVLLKIDRGSLPVKKVTSLCNANFADYETSKRQSVEMDAVILLSISL